MICFVLSISSLPHHVSQLASSERARRAGERRRQPKRHRIASAAQHKTSQREVGGY